MPSIRVNRVLDIPEANDFVLVGEIEGPIGPGDFVRIPVKAGHRVNFLIDRIVGQQGENDFEVHIRALPTLARILREIELIGETFETEDFQE